MFSRPWYRPLTRFSLRTLLVVTTLVCGYLAWQGYVVRQRKAVLASPQAHHIVQVITSQQWIERYAGRPPTPPVAIPLVRRWLGDVAIQQIYFEPWGEGHKSTYRRLGRLFPEAEISEFLFEPCHPGCFPVGTLVETSRGPRPIETIEVGDSLLSFGPDGSRATARVSSIFKTENRLWRVVTEQGELVTTEAQPLYVDLSEARPVGELAPGDTLQIVREGHLLSTRVVAITPTDRAGPVVNLVLGDSRPFVAGGFVARSKPPADCDCPEQQAP